MWRWNILVRELQVLELVDVEVDQRRGLLGVSIIGFDNHSQLAANISDQAQTIRREGFDLRSREF